MRPTRSPQPTARTRAGALVVGALALVTLVGCGSAVVSAGGPASSTSTPGTSTSGVPTPATTPAGPSTSTAPPTSPSTLPRPVASGPASVVGTVREGVEPSCLVLGPYVLTGVESLPAAQRALLRVGAPVAVTGEVDPGMASYCQQGTLLTVASVRALHPMTPDPRATPTIYSTP